MNTKPCVEAQMLIRKPVSTVFNAFIDPAITRHFWFTKGSGKLTEGATITWEWEMYNVVAAVKVKKIIDNELIAVDWNNPTTSVDFMFQSYGDDRTYVVIRNYGFSQQGEELIKVINAAAGGLTTVLDGLKAYLEHGIELNLVADKFSPKS